MKIALPGSGRIAALLLGLAVMSAAWGGSSENWSQCIQPLGVVATPSSVSTASNAVDRGNVTVMEMSGDYRRGSTPPRIDVAQAFYRDHPDRYDFLVVFTTFEFDSGEAIAFYNAIKNDTDGIGSARYDNSALFGSGGALQGYVDMAALGRYSFLPTTPSYKFLLDTLAHELMHRWVEGIHYRQGDGTLSAEMMGRDAAHWSYFLDTDASVMYGSQWQARGDGSFEAIDVRHRYSPLDLYVAGFAASAEVPAFGLIRGGTGSALDYPLRGAVTPGTLESIDVSQVIAAEGPRVPDAAHAQKDFRAAMILLTRPGETVKEENLVALEQLRGRFQQRFAQMTGGRGTLRIGTERKNAAVPGLPQILIGSGHPANAPGTAAALAWLEARQLDDGHWEDRPATAVRDTVAVLGALGELHPQFEGLGRARTWLATQSPANLDQLSARLSTGQGAGDLPTLLQARAAGSGWGLNAGWIAAPFDSAVAIRGLSAAGRNGDVPLEALQYLVDQQDTDGGFGVTASGRARVLATLRIGDALGAGGANFSNARSRAGAWLASRQKSDGGFGDDLASSVADSVEVFVAGDRLALGNAALEGTRLYVASAQQTQGDWAGSVYTTALAAQASAHDALPNLALAGSLRITPASLRDGDHAVLAATITNTARLPAAASHARWYLGDPRSGGTPIGASLEVPAIAGFDQLSIGQSWDTTGLAGDVTVWLVLDADHAVTETSEDDNFASAPVHIAAPSSTPDLLLDAAELQVSPSSIGALPANVHVSGVLRNAGLAAVPAAALRLLDVRGSGDTTLAQTMLAVPARGSVPFDLSFSATSAATLRLAVVADPDNLVAESNETNNRAETALGAQASLNLSVAAADLDIATAASVGHDVALRIRLHNPGTVDSPLTPLRVRVVQNGTTYSVFDGGVQLAAGGSSVRQLVWRPPGAGDAQLLVDIDPDNVVAESDETDNHASLSFPVSLTASADLAIADDSLAIAPSPALEGAPASASLRVRNLGNTHADAFAVALYTRDPALGGVPLAKVLVAGLAAGADTPVSVPIAAMSGSGDEHVYAMVDADAQIAEADESNNIAVSLLRVLALPDVAVTVVDIVLTPALPVPGEPVRADVSVHNLGGQPAQNILVHFYQGGVVGGAEVGSAQPVATLAPGASAALVWNWTLAADTQQVSVVATPGGGVPDANPQNDSATLPFDVQDGDFFTSERYLSPDGDGVHDAAAVVFRLPAGSTGTSVEVRNGASRVVRHFSQLATRGDGRAQILWDGRDDAQRIVPDGDYRVVAVDAAGQDLGAVTVTVDLNRSSPLEAVHTPYAVMAQLPSLVDRWQRLPREGGFGNDVVGISRYDGGVADKAAVYRSDVVLPRAEAVVSPKWVEAYLTQRGLASSRAGVTGLGVSPDGVTLVFSVRTLDGGTPASSLFRTRIDQSDTVQLLAADVPLGYGSDETIGFFDADEALVWRAGQNPVAVNVHSGATRVLTFPGGEIRKLTPAGIVYWIPSQERPYAFVPRNGAAAVPLDADVQPGDVYRLSPDGSTIARQRVDALHESVVLMHVADAGITPVYAVDTFAIPSNLVHATLQRLQMAWMELDGQLLVGDSAHQRILRFDAAGQPLGQSALLPIARQGDYLVDMDGNGHPAVGTDTHPLYKTQVFHNAVGIPSDTPECRAAADWTQASSQRRFYDPASDRVYFGTQEAVSYVSTYSGIVLSTTSGITDYQTSTLGAPDAQRLSAATFMLLDHPADRLQYPKIGHCEDGLPPDWPTWMLADGSRVRADQRVETLSGGVKEGLWAYAANVVDVWPDETHLAIGDPGNAFAFNQVFSSLLNETAVLRLTALGRGIQLYGNATDRNFAYYQIDWTDADAPGTWHVVTPPSHDQVFLDEFLTWVPPQPGNFLVRLRVTDLAGNVVTATATATSQDEAPIEALQVEPRNLSPNGDGVQDEAVAKFVVRQPVSLAFSISDENGAVLRHVSQTYGATELGAREFHWDGRDDGGAVLPDGHYRFEVEGFGLWLTLDNRVPRLESGLDTMRLHVPMAPAPPFLASYLSFRAADIHLNVLDAQSGPVGGDWSLFTHLGIDEGFVELPEDAANKTTSALKLGIAEYTGKWFRVVAGDIAGNTQIHASGSAEDVLIPYGLMVDESAPLAPGVSKQHPPYALYAPASPLDSDDVVIVGQNGQTRLLVADAVGALDHLVVETSPRVDGDLEHVSSDWTVRAQQPATYSCLPFTCLEGSDDHVFDLPLGLDGLPGESLIWLRVRGVRGDGHTVNSPAIPIRVLGIAAPKNASFSLPGTCAIYSTELVPGAMLDAKLFLSVNDYTATYSEARPADGSINFLVPNFRDATMAQGYVEATGADGRVYRSASASVNVSCVDLPSGEGSGGGSGDTGSTLQVKVVGREACDATPTNHLQLSGQLGSTAGLQRGRLRYLDPSSTQWITAKDLAPASPFVVDLDTTGWPEGTTQASLEGDLGAGYVSQKSIDLPIVHTPPVVQIDVPGAGERVCPAHAASGDSLTIEGRVSSKAASGYELETQLQSDAGQWLCEDAVGLRGTVLTPGQKCVHLDQPFTPDGRNAFGLLSIAKHLPKDPGDLLSVRLRATNWSGATVCAANTVQVDTAVEIVERRTPSPRLASQAQNWLALSTAGATDFREARVYLKALETMSTHAWIAPATLVGDRWVASEPPLLELRNDTSTLGDFDLIWDGRKAGAAQSDGVYALVLDTQDHCGNAKRLTYFIQLDSSAPDIAITQPAASQLVLAPVLGVRGRVLDANLASWALSVDAGTPAVHQDIAASYHAVANGDPLGNFSRNGATGPATLHLGASDLLGNSAQVDVAVTLGAPSTLIGTAALQPDLFSPNGDGHVDTSRVALTLLHAAQVDIDVVNAGGTSLRSLRHGDALAAGSSATVWDGRGTANAMIADGTYSVRIVARNPDDIGYSESVDLPIELDASAPVLTVVSPSASLVGPNSAVTARADDPHLDHYRADLVRLRDGVSVASAEGSQSGSIYLAELANLEEGDYSLRLTASDRAGNVAQTDKPFILDRTAPDVAVSAPVAGAVLRGGLARSVRGHASDAHFATYALAIAPETLEQWTALASGSAAIADGEILAWTPQLPDGKYRLRLRAVDGAGNSADSVVPIEIDATPPTAAITAPLDGSTVRRAIDLVGTADDLHFRQFVLAVATPAQATAGQWSTLLQGDKAVVAGALAHLELVQPDGDYVLRLTVTDAVDLSASAQVRVHLDTQPPPVPIGLAAQVENNRHVLLQWTAVAAADLAGYTVYRDGARLNAAPLTPAAYRDQDAPEGRHTYSVRSIDTAGNESAPSNSADVLIDHTAPLASLIAPIANARIGGSLDVLGTAYSRDDFKEYRLSVQRVSPAGPSIDVRRSPLPQQVQTLGSWDTHAVDSESRVRLHLEAEDVRGNIGSADVEVIVDNQPPAAPTGLVVALASLDVDAHWNPNTESDLFGYLLYRDGQLVNAPNGASGDLRPFASADAHYLDTRIPDGSHVYTVRAIDQAGNVSGPSAPANLPLVENGPPHLTFAQPQPDTRFEKSLTAIAVSQDRDIVDVRFAFRKVGAAAWTPLGDAFSAPPYRVTWTPGALPYASYELRAVATDASGNVDPTPPVLPVTYTDLTAPDAPSALLAHAEGKDVHLHWNASAAADTAYYKIRRRTGGAPSEMQVPVGTTDYTDADRPIGDATYTVAAVDGYENESPESNESVAHVFALRLTQPYSPTSEAAVDLVGTAPFAGTVHLHIDGPGGGSELDAGSSDADGNVAINQFALSAGTTHIVGTLTDAAGNRSLPSEIWIDRGAVPSAPTGLHAAVSDHQVTASWNANPESNIVGYRVYRDDAAVPADATGTFPLSATSDTCCGDSSAVDGNAYSAWNTSWYSQQASDDGPALIVQFDRQRLFTAVQLDWNYSGSPPNVDLYAWSGHAWIALAHRSGSIGGGVTEELRGPAAYLTDQIKLVERGGDARNYYYAGLAELRVRERAVHAPTTRAEDTSDGHHVYRVSAINALGFESLLSDPAAVDVGDTVGPDAVVLSGSVTGSDTHLAWTPSASADVARYLLYRDGTAWEEFHPGDALSYDQTSLPNGTYVYQVQAFDAFENASALSNAVSLTVAVAGPGMPRQVSVQAPETGAALDISWLPGDGAAVSYYMVSRSLAEAGPYVAIAWQEETTLRDAPLLDGTRYYYTVDAIDGQGNESGATAPVSGVPRDRVAPDAPRLTYPTLPALDLTTQQASVAVCGFAEPGSSVVVNHDGLRAPAVPANALTTARDLHFASYRTVALSPDGSRFYVADYQSAALLSSATGALLASVPGSDEIAHWNAGGDAVYTASDYGNVITRRNVAGGAQVLALPFSAIRAFAFSSDERLWLVAGDYTDGGGTVSGGLWLHDLGTATTRRVGPWETYQIQTRSLRIAPDGHHASVVVDYSNAQVIDLATLQFSLVSDGVSDVMPEWSPDGSALAYAKSSESNLHLWTYSVSLRQSTDAITANDGIMAFAWKPDGHGLALLLSFRVGFYSASGAGYVADGVDYSNNANGAIAWSAAGTLAATRSDGARVIAPAGAFCSAAQSLRVGTNLFDAQATDSAGNVSLGADPIAVIRSGVGVIDLALGAQDLQFVPATGAPGTVFSAIVSVRNLGSATAAATDFAVEFTAPDGSVTRPPVSGSAHAWAPGEAQSFGIGFGALTQTGAYRLRVIVDPHGALADANRDNNEASATLQVTATDTPVISVGVTRAMYAPGEAVQGEVDLINPGSPFTGSVRVSVIDSADALVQDLGTSPVQALAFGAAWRKPIAWTPDVFAGSYRLRAQLVDRDNVLIASAMAGFAIDVTRNLDLRLQPDRVAPLAGQAVTLDTDLAYLSGNAPLEGAQLHWSVQAPGGATVWSSDQILGTLLPGYSLHRAVVWPGATQAGTYRAQVTLSNGGFQRVAAADIGVQAPAGIAAVSGALSFEPGVPFVAGQTMRLHYRADNIGDTALAGAQLRLRVLGTLGAPAVVQRTDSVDLPIGQHSEGVIDLATPEIPLGSYAAVLDAHLAGDAADSWRPLAQAGFAVIDGLPPEITLQQPDGAVVQPAVVPLTALISDRHSAVAGADVSIDGGSWQPLSLRGDGTYGRGLSGLSDGAHRVAVRARDSWNNTAFTTDRAFSVDATPPRIQIDGISDGQLANHPLTPIVHVDDAHLSTTELFLNSQPFVSGDSVSLDGAYVLTVRATDAAGNNSSRVVRFTLDLQPPALSIVSPADGSTTSSSAIHVIAQSEAAATLHLTTGAYHADLVADAQGQADFAGVPLLPGDNTIAVRADDAAGNETGPLSIGVHYSVDPNTPLIGSLQPPGSELAAGAVLHLDVHATNPNATPLATQTLRVRVHDGANAVLAEQTLSHAFGANEAYAATLDFPSTGWALGALSLTLELDRGGSWSLLDTQSISLVDRTPPLLAAVAPSANAIVRSPVMLQATASDGLSAMGAVETRVDGADWQALNATTPGHYASAALDLDDGAHSYALRAADAAGNSTALAPIDFVVDTLAPQIVVSGVDEGDLLAHAVTPGITITEAHPGSSQIRLNGQAYVSATPITASGGYTLDVTATDAAGNAASTSVHFTLDLDAPLVTYTAPLPNAVVTTPTIGVSGHTEALAQVLLTTTGFSVTVTAEADGDFSVADVPLQSGANTLHAQATDRAGNVGPVASLSITYQPATAQTLTGSLEDTPSSVEQGMPLIAAFALHNPTAAVLLAQAVRIELRPAANEDVVAFQALTLDIPAQSTLPGNAVLGTASVPKGDYRLLLLALLPVEQGGTAWTTLDQATLSVTPALCHHTSSDVLFADGFEGGTPRDRLFCDDFEGAVGRPAAALRAMLAPSVLQALMPGWLAAAIDDSKTTPFQREPHTMPHAFNPRSRARRSGGAG